MKPIWCMCLDNADLSNHMHALPAQLQIMSLKPWNSTQFIHPRNTDINSVKREAKNIMGPASGVLIQLSWQCKG